MELQVIDNKGKESNKVQFDDGLLQGKASKAVLHEAVVAYLGNQRSGTHSTKNRSEVSGGGIKPWRQKGTGRARAGSIRSPLWRHGGVIFGPRPRDYRQDMPKRKKKLAFQLAVQNMIEENRMQVVDPISISEPKTKLVAAVYKKWNTPTDSIYVVDKKDAMFEQASRNIPAVTVMDAESLNYFHCLRARKVFITPSALQMVVGRISRQVER